jgi:hypothetical protein
MKPIPVLGLGGVPVSSESTSPTTYAYEGHCLLSRALALPDTEYERRERALKAYLDARVGHIIVPERDTIH